MNFDDLDLALENLYGEIGMRMIRNISGKYQSAGTYDAVARAFEDKGVRDDASNPKSKALHEMILDQWKMLSDAEKYIMLKYNEEMLGEERYRGYEDVDENIFSTMMDNFYDYVLDNPNPR
ncbi:MAG: hypothetical protein MJZ16_11820 [Bacteroidales bacterium]|nr:hypothetical protein [Bacteroidales bacterium]